MGWGWSEWPVNRLPEGVGRLTSCASQQHAHKLCPLHKARKQRLASKIIFRIHFTGGQYILAFPP